MRNGTRPVYSALAEAIAWEEGTPNSSASSARHLTTMRQEYERVSRELTALRKERAVLKDNTEAIADANAAWKGAHHTLSVISSNLAEAVQKLRWKSIDKDNMEFECRTTCFVMDEIRSGLNRLPDAHAITGGEG